MEDETTKKMGKKPESSFISTKLESFDLHGKKYNVVKTLSETSGEAQVYLLENDNENYVLKLYYPNFSPKLDLLKILSKLNSDNIVHLYHYGFLSQDTSSRCYELMEYLEGGSLEDYPMNNDEETFREITLSAAESLNVCHQVGIIHRDVKLSNFFFRYKEKKGLVLGDFGISSLSKEDEELHKTTQARTPIYAAPEMYMHVIDGEVELTAKIDYYSLGITLLCLWLGKNPFTGNERLIMQQKSEGKLPGIDQLPPTINTLIRGLTTVNPEFRWGYKEIQRWYNGENVPVSDDIPYLRYKKFLFDPDKESIAKNAKDLAELMKKDRDLGIRYLYNRRIYKWLDESGNTKLAMDINTIVESHFPLNQSAGVMAAIYILDRDQPFLLDSPYPTSTPQEIVEAFEKGEVTEDNFKALVDGRLLFWLSNKEKSELYNEVAELTKEGQYSDGLAYGVLYLLDKECGLKLSKEYNTKEEIGGLLSLEMTKIQDVDNLNEYTAALEHYIGEYGRLYYYSVVHGWNDVIKYRDEIAKLINQSEDSRFVGEYNIPIASYQFCAKLGYTPGYLYPRSKKVTRSMDEMENVSEREIKQEIRNGKLKEWMAIFYYAKPFEQYKEEYSYEESLATFLKKVDEYNPTGYYAKRFFMAVERQTNKEKRVKKAFLAVRLLDAGCILLFLILGSLLTYLLWKYGIENQSLFINNYPYNIVFPVLIFGFLYFAIKSFNLSTGVIVSILFVLLGGVITAAPVAIAYWLIITYPGYFSSIIMGLIVFYVLIILFLGLGKSTHKIRALKGLYEYNIKYMLVEPLFFAYKSTASKYKSSNEKLLKDGIEVIRLTKRKLLTFYVIWITLCIYFLIIYICFNSNFMGFEAPEITWEAIKDFFRFRSTP